MKTKEELKRESASIAWQEIETNLHYILQHLKDAREAGNIEERASEIERHVWKVKELYDWLDNFCVVDFY